MVSGVGFRFKLCRLYSILDGRSLPCACAPPGRIRQRRRSAGSHWYDCSHVATAATAAASLRQRLRTTANARTSSRQSAAGIRGSKHRMSRLSKRVLRL